MFEHKSARRVMARGMVVMLLGCAALGFQPGRWLAVAAAAAETPAAEHLQQGIELYKQGRYEQALAAFARVTAVETAREVRRDALLYSGFALISLGHSEEGEERYRQALELDPALRLDPVFYPPPLTEPFERVRRMFFERAAPSLVTITQGQVYLSPAEKKPSLLRAPWYKKWWVWGLGGLVLAGAVAAMSTGGTVGPEAPMFQVEVLVTDAAGMEHVATPEQPLNCVQVPENGSYQVRFVFQGSKGNPPYHATFSYRDDNNEAAQFDGDFNLNSGQRLEVPPYTYMTSDFKNIIGKVFSFTLEDKNNMGITPNVVIVPRFAQCQ